MSLRTAASLTFVALALGALPVAAQEPLVVEKAIKDGISAKVTVTIHSDKAKMVACTDVQLGELNARAEHHLTELTPVLLARVISRKDPSGTVLAINLDAACYDGGIVALAGYGQAGEDVLIPYEEKTGEGDWGPMPRTQQAG